AVHAARGTTLVRVVGDRRRRRGGERRALPRALTRDHHAALHARDQRAAPAGPRAARRVHRRQGRGQGGSSRRRKGREVSARRDVPAFDDEHEALLSQPNTAKGKLQRHALALLFEHEANDELPTNGRFLFYELEQRGVVEKNRAGRTRTDAQDLSDAT